MHKIVGGAFCVFNEAAAFLVVLYKAKNLKVLPQWLAHLWKPIGRYFYKQRKFTGMTSYFPVDRLSSSILAWQRGHIYPAICLAGKLEQHRLYLHAWDSGHTFEFPAHPEKRSATTYCCGQPAGIFVTLLVQCRRAGGCPRAAQVAPSTLPYRGGKPAGTNCCPLSPLPKAISILTHINIPAACAKCMRWPCKSCIFSQTLTVYYSALQTEQGARYPSSGWGFYLPWKDSTSADKSDIFSLTFLTATTFEAFSFHPPPCCCCRGCHSVLKSGDLPHKAAAAASAPCPCEYWMQLETGISS